MSVVPDLAESRTPEGVSRMFDGIAARYDRINDLMTGGMHRLWKRRLVAVLGLRQGDRVLDLCSGTGDLALLEATVTGAAGEVVGLDFSDRMLGVARTRPVPAGAPVSWVLGDATRLTWPDATFRAVSVGFGLRNVQDLDAALAEAYRVLEPGGSFASLDLGKPRSRFLRLLTAVHASHIAPWLAWLAGGDRAAYAYLPRSNRHFPDQRELAGRLEAVGFTEVAVVDLGLGAVALVSGRKPVAGPSA
ncbi:MAG: ubiquinone/menaquinone biosynthesis methyltransferase [Candidatus Sericytochromatia bacterium]|nr:ubiquinone/menaquinone biosynthesis methyltransferase [Candidatus Sericytochromatia bacterium]